MFLVQVGCPRETTLFFSVLRFNPRGDPFSRRPVSRIVGYLKGTIAFTSPSARQFEFLIERKEVSSCGWVLGNCAIGTDT